MDLRLLVCQTVGLKDYDKLALDFVGDALTDEAARMDQVGLCDQAILVCSEANKVQQQELLAAGSFAAQQVWATWAGIQSSGVAGLARQHSGLGGVGIFDKNDTGPESNALATISLPLDTLGESVHLTPRPPGVPEGKSDFEMGCEH